MYLLEPDCEVRLQEFVEYFTRKCLSQTDVDLLFNGISLSVGFLFKGRFYFANIGSNLVIAMSDPPEVIIETFETHRHTLARIDERLRVSQRLELNGVQLDLLDKFETKGAQAPLNQKGMTVSLEATRCIGNLAANLHGVNSIPEYGVIEVAGKWTGGVIFSSRAIADSITAQEVRPALTSDSVCGV